MTKALLIAALQPFDDDAPVTIELVTSPKFLLDGITPNTNSTANLGIVGEIQCPEDESYAVNKGSHCTLLINNTKFIE